MPLAGRMVVDDDNGFLQGRLTPSQNRINPKHSTIFTIFLNFVAENYEFWCERTMSFSSPNKSNDDTLRRHPQCHSSWKRIIRFFFFLLSSCTSKNNTKHCLEQHLMPRRRFWHPTPNQVHPSPVSRHSSVVHIRLIIHNSTEKVGIFNITGNVVRTFRFYSFRR